MLEAREGAGELRHRSARVNETKQRLRLLDREVARDRLASTRRGLPIDVPRIVANNVFAKAGEASSLSALFERANARLM